MNEKLSSLYDSEMDSEDQGKLISQLCEDSNLAAAWSRYSLISHMLVNEDRDDSVVRDLSGRISEKIALEPIYIAPDVANPSQLEIAEQSVDKEAELPQKVVAKNNIVNFTPMRAGIIGFALAASIAVISIVGLGQGFFKTDSNNREIATLEDSNVLNSIGQTRWDTDIPAQESDLNSLLVEHGEFMPPSGLNGLMAYAKFVSYDAGQ